MNVYNVIREYSVNTRAYLVIGLISGLKPMQCKDGRKL